MNTMRLVINGEPAPAGARAAVYADQHNLCTVVHIELPVEQPVVQVHSLDEVVREWVRAAR